ncbi:MAG: filamentous hemagglutinin N-terminal domain-containing protein [Nitrospirales bacterium]
MDGSLGGNPGPVGPGTLPNGQTLFNGLTTTDHLITQDLGRTVGNNLFHSFSEFSVQPDKSATFTGQDSIANIVSRVTGSNVSQIDGLLASTIDNANLYLLNPNGVIFGENAQLDINGSFYTSNADIIRLGDDGLFYASLDESSVLTAAPPEAFGFLSSTSAIIDKQTQSTIRVEGLDVINGNTVTLIGRDVLVGVDTEDGIIISGGILQSPNGRVNLISIGATQSPGIEQVSVEIDSLRTQRVSTAGDVISEPVRMGSTKISQGATINTSGYAGGTVMIRGGQLLIEGSQISANVSGSAMGSIGQGIEIEMTDTVAITKASRLETNVTVDAAEGISSGGIYVKAKQVEIQGDLDMFSFSELHSDIAQNSMGGTSGNITIEANDIIQNFSVLNSQTGASADGGNISLQVSGNIEMKTSQVNTISSGPGKAGNIDVSVTTGQLSMNNGSGITTQSFVGGEAGRVNIIVGETIQNGEITTFSGGDIFLSNGSIVFSVIQESGKGGHLQIQAGSLELSPFSFISVQNFTQNQRAGEIMIDLTENLTVENFSTIDTITATSAPAADLKISAASVLVTDGSLIATSTQGSGKGGNLDIRAKNVTISREGMLSSQSFQGSGQAGNIHVNVSEHLSLANKGTILSSTSTTGKGGNIELVGKNLSLTNGALITADSTSAEPSAGDSGTITLTGMETISISGSSVSTKAVKALGGNIQLTAKDKVQITNSNLTTNVLEGSENAGAIGIDPDFVVIQNSNILSTAVSGDGGPITIIANSAVLVDPFSTLDASSQFGGNGTIDIQAPIQQLSEAIAPLPEDIVKAAALYAEACASQKAGQFSSMVKNTDSTISPPPTGFLSSPLTFHIPDLSPPGSQQAQLSPTSSSSNVFQDFLAHMTWKIHDPLPAAIPFQPCTTVKG